MSGEHPTICAITMRQEGLAVQLSSWLIDRMQKSPAWSLRLNSGDAAPDRFSRLHNSLTYMMLDLVQGEFIKANVKQLTGLISSVIKTSQALGEPWEDKIEQILSLFMKDPA